MAVIALDLGATKLAGAIVTRMGTIRRRSITLLDDRQGPEVGALICSQLRSLVGIARAGRIRVSGIGVCVPGISHVQNGTIWAPNIRGWEEYPLRREILSALKPVRIEVAIDSDRACSILGEAWLGAARRCNNAVFMAVGTGIGAGILVEGRVLRGAHDIAGAIGWMVLDRPFRPDYVACGCFEQHASGEGLAKAALERLEQQRRKLGTPRSEWPWPRHPTARDVFRAHAAGDAVAREVVERAIESWGMAAANLISVFNPEKVVFGGGVFGPARRFLPRVRAEAAKWAQPVSFGQVRIMGSKLGGDAALLGAARLALLPPRQDR
jgi:glucokinase